MRDVISLSTTEIKPRVDFFFFPQEGRVISNAVEMSERIGTGEKQQKRIGIGEKSIRQSLVTFDERTLCFRQ